MNTIQLYLFLKNSEAWEIQTFAEQYGVQLTKKHVRKLQDVLRSIPFYELKWPLEKRYIKQIESILGDDNFQKLMKIWQIHYE